MNKKKRPLMWILLSPALALAAYSLIFMANSKSYEAAFDYCVENSKIGATSFDDVDTDENYLYVVSKEVEGQNSVECYVFRRKSFLGFGDYWMRFVPFAQGHDTQSNTTTLTITLRDDKGDKQPGNTVIVFGNAYIKNANHIGFDLAFDVEKSGDESKTYYTKSSFQPPFVILIRYDGRRWQYGWSYPEDADLNTLEPIRDGDKISNTRIVDLDGNVVFEYN